MGNREVRVVEGGAKPTRGGMAGIASGWISGGDVIRNGATQRLSSVPVRSVAAVASGIRRG